MVHPQFVQERPLSLADVKDHIEQIEKRDQKLNNLSQKCKEYFDAFSVLPVEKKEALRKKLESLELTRLKPEHIMKIADFLPKTATDLKIVLQAYPLSLPKKDQDAIIAAVQEVAGGEVKATEA